jgi:hypothetical protein
MKYRLSLSFANASKNLSEKTKGLLSVRLESERGS